MSARMLAGNWAVRSPVRESESERMTDLIIALNEALRRLGEANGRVTETVEGLAALIHALAGEIQSSGTHGLYDADGLWWFGLGHIGFDCDDFADAWACRRKSVAEGAGVTVGVKTLRVTWTKVHGGKKGRHRIVKVKVKGLYWLVDPETGRVSGPHSSGKPADGGTVVGGYAKDESRPVNTDHEERDVGVRPEPAEPRPWYESPEQEDRFRRITGRDPAEYEP